VNYNQVGIVSSAAVAKGVGFHRCRDGHFYAVDARTGTKEWFHDNQKGWVIASRWFVTGWSIFQLRTDEVDPIGWTKKRPFLDGIAG
jgi:outer membrane protein assembly factor BamB